jgi:hypothetical protein
VLFFKLVIIFNRFKECTFLAPNGGIQKKKIARGNLKGIFCRGKAKFLLCKGVNTYFEKDDM